MLLGGPATGTLLEVWDHTLAKEANGMAHFLMLRRAYGAEQENFLNT